MNDDLLDDLVTTPRGRLPRRGRSLSSRGAIYHLSVRTGTRSKNQSARAAAAYIQREQEYERGRAQEDELVYAESGHMPRWADAEPAIYWDAADQYERANGRLFKRVEMALPLALNEEERRELAVGFAHHLTDAERLPYTLALHAGKGTNPHAHLLISERGNDGLERDAEQWFKRYNAAAPARGGARKSTALHPKAWLEETRAAWAAQTNAALERAGHEVRIDHRSLEAQGSDRLPGLHVGPVAAAMEKRGIETVRGRAAAAIARENAELERDRAEIERALAVIQAQEPERQAEQAREPERARTRRGWVAAKELAGAGVLPGGGRGEAARGGQAPPDPRARARAGAGTGAQAVPGGRGPQSRRGRANRTNPRPPGAGEGVEAPRDNPLGSGRPRTAHLARAGTRARPGP